MNTPHISSREWSALGDRAYLFSAAKHRTDGQRFDEISLKFRPITTAWAADIQIRPSASSSVHDTERSSAQNTTKEYSIERVGFWKNSIEIRDSRGISVLRTRPMSWFSSKTIVEFDGREYILSIVNDPLAGFKLALHDEIQLQYNLVVQDKRPRLRILERKPAPPELLHAFLWYVSLPIVEEDASGDVDALVLV